ncbi:MAG: GNAT family N-acetyltransferase [Acidobacteriota bacterium]|nr:GNAT family N-acetyltransferase [Acidobacteriota bacterium]
MAPSINSLVWATDVDVLAADHMLERRAGYWVVQSPRNPTYWWGNFLLFDDPPSAGDGERWEALFADEFAARGDVTHCTLAWDRVDGEQGAAEHELVARGYGLEWSSGLIARPDQITPHRRGNREVEVRMLDPVAGAADEALWAQVIELRQAQAGADDDPEYHLRFVRRHQHELRELLAQGDSGSWFVALLDGHVAASLGVVVTGSRARYQLVQTAAAHRRSGIATRLVAEAATQIASQHKIDHFVIVADPDYHAIGIYEGLGFERVELVVGALRKPAHA